MPRGSSLEQVEEEGKWQTPVHLEKRPFNGSTSSYQLVLILKCHWKDVLIIWCFYCMHHTFNSLSLLYFIG